MGFSGGYVMDIKIDGLEAIVEQLDNLVDEPTMRKRMGQACAVVERTARQKAPKGNGDLRRSITSKVETIGGTVVGTVFTPLEYAPYVEYGTGLFAEKGGRCGYWVFVEGSTKKSKDGGKTYTLEEAKRVVAMMRKKGLKAYYTNGRKPHPFMRPALYENTENIKRKLKGGNDSD